MSPGNRHKQLRLIVKRIVSKIHHKNQFLHRKTFCDKSTLIFLEETSETEFVKKYC